MIWTSHLADASRYLGELAQHAEAEAPDRRSLKARPSDAAATLRCRRAGKDQGMSLRRKIDGIECPRSEVEPQHVTVERAPVTINSPAVTNKSRRGRPAKFSIDERKAKASAKGPRMAQTESV